MGTHPIFESDFDCLTERNGIDELADKLARRCKLNDDKSGEKELGPKSYRSIYAEFEEFPLKKIRGLEEKFKKYDVDNDHALNIEELKKLMEGLGEPQTHRAVKDMIELVDEDRDGKVSFRKFLMMFRKSSEGAVESESGLDKLVKLTEMDVSAAGVSGAKNFFQAKVAAFEDEAKITDEIRAEIEEKKRKAEEARLRREEFKKKQSLFGSK